MNEATILSILKALDNLKVLIRTFMNILYAVHEHRQIKLEEY